MIFQTVNSDISNNLSLKYQNSTLLGCNDIGIWRFEFVAKTPWWCETDWKRNVIETIFIDRGLND